MRHVFGSAAGAILLGMALSGTAQAQVFTPTYTSPRLINEIGVFLSDGPGDMTIEGFWRGGPIGLRVGYVDLAGGLLSVGGELRSPIAMVGTPLGLAFTAGGQGIFGDASGAGVQAGLSAGYTFMSPGIAFTPYLHPRVAMINAIGGATDWEFDVLADVGLDVELHNNIVARVGANLAGAGSSWGVGLSIRR
jgi:hypothetical protein